MRGVQDHRAVFDVERGATIPDPAEQVRGAGVVYREHRQLHTTYYDTSDLRLLRRGMTLARVVEPAHDHDRWCLELPAGTAHATYRRHEVCWPGASDSVPDGATRLLGAVIRGRPLEQVGELVVLRHSTELRDHDGRPLLSVSDDDVSSGGTGEFRQVELEIATEDQGVAESLIASLEASGARPQTGGPLLGRLLSERLARTAHQDVTARALGPSARFADIVEASLSNGLARLLEHEVGARLDDDPEFVHQARVAVRRLRSDLKTLRGLLDGGWVDGIRDELRWLGTALGDVRDADVLAGRQADERLDEDPVLEGRAALAQRLADRRQAALARLEQVLDSQRYRELIGRLDAACHVTPWAEGPPDDEGARAAKKVMRAVWRRWRRAAEQLGPEPTDHQLHRLRIKTKQVRYAAELLAPVVGRHAEKLARRAEHLQEVLGEHQDAVMGGATMWEIAAAGPIDLAFAAGRSAGLELERRDAARTDWSRRCEKLARWGDRRWPGS